MNKKGVGCDGIPTNREEYATAGDGKWEQCYPRSAAPSGTLVAAPTQIRVAIEEMTISDVLQGAVYFFMAVFFRERAMPSNETKISYRYRHQGSNPAKAN